MPAPSGRSLSARLRGSPSGAFSTNAQIAVGTAAANTSANELKKRYPSSSESGVRGYRRSTPIARLTIPNVLAPSALKIATTQPLRSLRLASSTNRVKEADHYCSRGP